MLVLVAALYVAVRPWLIDTFGVPSIVVLVLVTGTVVSLVLAWWQSRNRRYTCPACAHVFPVTMLRNLASQNWFGRLHTRCPSCDKLSWCDIATDD
jgi:hypothetical protein